MNTLILKAQKIRMFFIHPFKKGGILLLIGLMFINPFGFPQSEFRVDTTKIKVDTVAVRGSSDPSLPMLTTPSPKATMMNRYGNYPVSLYTGLVDITIPIYEININGISVPIEFKYHASGLRYDDLPMELGYGWTLKAGGTISHGVRGTPDGRSFSGGGTQANPYAWVKNDFEI